ncbi:hypothetical protein G7043_44350 [Lentzea sp. NEAU-D13]|uniref:Uncharacterized protein n=1 Tax=Lentzea alba TaxID=2714351 RepID=A0A7C9W5J1_9PSEU|nr:hypothetical protein [Lentzea alba]NGY65941.1 hypothetical protein [Lentzea alba]
MIAIVLITISCAFLLITPGATATKPESGDRWLTEQMLGLKELRGYYPLTNHEVPAAEVIQGNGVYFDTIRQGSLITAHLRGYASMDGSSDLDMWLIETTNAEFSGAHRGEARPGFDARLNTFTQERTDDERTNHTVIFGRGRVKAKISLMTSSPADTAVSTIQGIANQQYAKLADSPDLSDQKAVSLRTVQIRLYVGTVLTLLLLQLGIWLAVCVNDRSTRERILRFVLRRQLQPWRGPARFDDVSDEARTRARNHTRGAVIRGAIFLALFTATYQLTTVRQFLLFAALGAVVSLVQVFTARRGFAAVQGFRASLVVVATSATGIALAGTGLQAILLTAVAPLAAPAELSQEGLTKATQIFFVIGLMLLALADIPHRLARRFASRNAQRRLAADGRQEILLLRSFLDDNLKIRTRRTGRHNLLERLALRRRERVEELVAWCLWRQGPVVALGEPGTKLPPLGAARTYHGADWQQAVKDKIHSCRFVVFLVGRTPSLKWEISAVRQAGALQRAIFVIPPVPLKEARARLTVLASALGMDEQVFPPFDLRHEFTLVLGFDVDGTPRLHVADGRDDTALLLALEHAAEAVQPAAQVWLADPSPAAAAVPRSVDSLLRVSPTRREARAARWSRRWQTWPWLASISLSFLSSALVAVGPAAPPLPPMPGTALSQTPLSSTAVVGAGKFIGADRTTKQLVSLDQTGTTPVHTMTEIPQLLTATDNMVFVSTFRPYTLIALRGNGAGYDEIWRVSLPSIAFGIQVVNDRVAVVTPRTEEVRAFDVGTGANMTTTKLPGGPLALASHQGQLLVASTADNTLTWVDPHAGTPGRKMTLPVIPDHLQVVGDTLFVSSIENSALVKLSLVDGQVHARAEIGRFNGIMTIGARHVMVGTYDETPKLFLLDAGKLDQESVVDVPRQLTEAMFSDSAYYIALGTPGVLTRIPEEP